MFTIESLADVDDGSLGVAFKREVLRAARDVMDRPKSKKKRTFSIKVHLIGLTDEDGHLRGASLECELVPTRIPNYCTYPQKAAITMNGLELDQPMGVGIKQQIDPEL